MTNAATNTTRSNRSFSSAGKGPDHAPMVVTRLSGWIDIGENKTAAPAWIVPTRARARR